MDRVTPEGDPLTPAADPDAVHTWFSLSYSNYLVLPRTLMQSMPGEWQSSMVKLLDEMNAAFAHIKHPEDYHVQTGTWGYPNEQTDEQLKESGWSRSTRDEDEDSESVYFDPHGQEHDGHSATFFIASEDPIPHYNRGRTRVEPRIPVRIERSEATA